jgi:capsule polysaccharide export protein KpsC/LpsZ
MKKNKKVIIFNESKLSWTHIDVHHFKKRLESNNLNYIPLSEINESKLTYETNKIYTSNEVYKTILLFDVCIYNICNELNIFKNEICFEAHSKVINKWYFIAERTIDYLEVIFKKNNVNGAIVFHGHLLFDACLLAMCKIYDVKFITLEITSNKNKLVWDTLSGYVVNYNMARNYFFREQKKINKEIAFKYCEDYIKQIDSYKSLEHISNLSKDSNSLPFSDPYILYIGQVYNDASQLFALGNEVENPIDIIKKVSSIAKDIGCKLIIKLHPKEVNGVNPVTTSTYNKPTFSRLSEVIKNEHVIIDEKNNYNTYDLIKDSRVVVTVNSQAGLESCLFNKPVLTYYKGFFSGIGFTHDYSNFVDLENKLKEILMLNEKGNKDLTAAKYFFYIFNEIYCIQRSELSLFNKITEVFNFEKEKNKIIMALKKYTLSLNKNSKK